MFVRNSSLVDSTRLQKQDDAHRQRCSGMYSRKSWGGDVDPFILVKFSKEIGASGEDILASLIVFEWNDEPLIGIARTQDAEVRINNS